MCVSLPHLVKKNGVYKGTSFGLVQLCVGAHIYKGTSFGHVRLCVGAHIRIRICIRKRITYIRKRITYIRKRIRICPHLVNKNCVHKGTSFGHVRLCVGAHIHTQYSCVYALPHKCGNCVLLCVADFRVSYK